jgi:predicted nucleotidyltransferase
MGNHVLLSGTVGSTAYGLAHEDSDTDWLGMFAVDTVRLHGLEKPTESIVTKDPDTTLHEAAKWCRLALNGNPTVMELAWLPENLYDVRTALGDELREIRTAFLSAPRVRNAYLGYATQQFRKLESRGDGTFSPDLAKRTAKHARHMNRLLLQGLELWTTGSLTIRIVDPESVCAFGELVADGDIDHAKRVLTEYERWFDRMRPVLPEQPDTAVVEAWLRKVRRTYYKGE